MGWLSNSRQGGNTKISSSGSAEQVVSFYQQLGFFAAADAADILARYARTFGEALDPGEPWDDAFLLSLGDPAVWSANPEANVSPDNRVYSRVLKEWAQVSSGAFRPTDIREHWDTGAGPVRISFKIENQPITIQPDYLHDWLDLDVLKQINPHIAESGRQFAYAADGNFSLALCLTREQKNRMRRERLFPFAW